MRWLKRDIWKAGIGIAGMLLLLVFMVWVPVSAAGAYEVTPGLATPTTGTVQATPTVDPTMTALQKEQLTQQVKQLQNWWLYWLYNGSTAFIAAFATLAVAVFGLYQWRVNRKDERKKEVEAQDKDLKAQAEERFKTAVTALGDEKEGVQVGGAILLRSFLNKDDKSYERYYPQVFDLAVAYLRLSRTSKQPEDPDRLSHPPEDPDAPLSPTTLSQALIMVFKEAFPRARSQNQGSPQTLDATSIQLDNAYLFGADLKQAWMPQTSLRKANLIGANLSGANLSGADLNRTDLSGANLIRAALVETNLNNTTLTSCLIYGIAACFLNTVVAVVC